MNKFYRKEFNNCGSKYLLKYFEDRIITPCHFDFSRYIREDGAKITQVEIKIKSSHPNQTITNLRLVDLKTTSRPV